MPVDWKVELLGGLRLHAQGQTISRFRTQRAASLLAYLCFYPRQHSRDSLADLLWPDSDIEAARANLRQSLSQIRAAVKAAGLDPDTLLDTPGKNTVGIRTANVRTDVAAFLQAVESKRANLARQHYSGPLLPGFWDDWLLDERDRLEELYQSLEVTDGQNPIARLPLPLSRFFGRQEELRQLQSWLLPSSGTRLVTLLGTGGVGKTRLALAAADSLRGSFQERIGFVSLAALTDSRLVFLAIMTGLGIASSSSDEPLDQLVEFFGTEPYLLVLDNLEQLAGTVSASLHVLLERVPNLTCLVTSRRRLGLAGERLLTVGVLGQEESVALFCDRAGVASCEAVERLCALLEGVPLALELAANRVGALTVSDMIGKIGERLSLLTTQETDKTSRHRSLHAVMDWSVRLLTRDQRRFFAALSVFRGGCSAEAAEVVCDEPAALEYLSQLRDRSLLLAEERDSTVRWRMLESLREFAESLLTESERGALVLRHGEYLISFARTNQRALLGSEVEVHRQYAAELENFRFALSVLPPEKSVSLLAELVNFFMLQGLLTEGAAWLESVYSHGSKRSKDLATLLTRSTVLYHYLRRFDDSIRVGVDGIALLRKFESGAELAQALTVLSYIYNEINQIEKSKPLLEEALYISQQENNPALTAECQAALGDYHQHQGELDQAIRYSVEALHAARALNRTNLESTLLNRLAIIYLHKGDFMAARATCKEAITLGESLGQSALLTDDYKLMAIVLLSQKELATAREFVQKLLESAWPDRLYLDLRDGFSLLAQICCQQKEFALAAEWVGVCQALTARHPLPEFDEYMRLESTTAELRSALGGAAYEQRVAQGYARALNELEKAVHDL